MPTHCTRCQNTGQKQVVVLVCDHELCVPCAQEIKKPEGTPPLDAKFRLICPKCGKNTLTHNVGNLINQQNDKLLFQNMESSELNESSLGHVINVDQDKGKFSERELKQMSYSQRFSNIWAERKTPDITERGSKASNQSKRNNKNSSSRAGAVESNISTQCHIHKENLMFFCEQEKRVMCMQCIYKHTKDFKSHKIYQIKEAMSTIEAENKHFKQEAKRKMEEVEKCINVCKNNKNKVQQAYEYHLQHLDKQFQQLQTIIKSKKSESVEYLQKAFQKKQKQVNVQINDFNYLRNCLKEHYEYPLQNEQSNLYFFNAFNILRDAIQKGFTKIKAIDKEDLSCFDKLSSISDFKNLLQKFLKPKKDGRQTKVQSRGASEYYANSVNPQSKNIIPDEYKSAKKNLEKINKMQKQHKGNKEKNFHYLNNYVIDIQKKDENDRGAMTIRQRKSSMGAYLHHEQKKIVPNKALTPTRLMSSKPKKK